MAIISKFNTLQNNYSPPPTNNIPRIVYFCADTGGCMFWRIGHISSYLSSYGKAVTMISHNMIMDHNFYTNIDTVVLQRQCTVPQIEFIKGLYNLREKLRKDGFKGFRLIYEVDDVIAPAEFIPNYNACKEGFNNKELENNLREMFKYVDEMMVPSQYMRNHYYKHFGFSNISVSPNYMPSHLYDRYTSLDARLMSYERHRKRPRILYSGSGTHFDVMNATGFRDDFAHVLDAMYSTVDEFEWVFQGGYPLRFKNLLADGRMKNYGWCGLFDHAKTMAELDCQVTIAPLADNTFNRSKSHIKLTESGVLHTPCIAQNLHCYKDGILNFDTGEQMLQQIRKVLKNKKTYAYYCKQNRAYAEQFFIENHMDELVMIYNTDYNAPVRKNNAHYMSNNKALEEPPVLDAEYFNK